MDEELLKEVLSDSDFAKSIVEMETPEEVQTALKGKGVEISLEDIAAIKNALSNQDEEGALSEDELENVSGGSLTIMAAIGIASIITASVAGTVSLGNKVNTWTNRRW
jgi:predicted ribosomally synthesized peptide with nif11-like leader